MAILEGMASSRPPHRHRVVGEVPTVVLDNQSGILLPPEDPWPLLATAITSLLRNPAERQRLGNAARKRIEDEFSAARMTADYLRAPTSKPSPLRKKSREPAPTAKGLHDGSVGDRAVLHGISLTRSLQGRRRFNRRLNLLLPRCYVLLQSRNQARPWHPGRSRQVSSATPAAPNPQAARVHPQSVRAHSPLSLRAAPTSFTCNTCRC